jgi:hypothetical protein
VRAGGSSLADQLGAIDSLVLVLGIHMIELIAAMESSEICCTCSSLLKMALVDWGCGSR